MSDRPRLSVLQSVAVCCSVLQRVAMTFGSCADIYLTGLDYLHTPDFVIHKFQVCEMIYCNTMQYSATSWHDPATHLQGTYYTPATCVLQGQGYAYEYVAGVL